MENRKSIYIVLCLVSLLALSRLIPHPPNFTPVLGMAVFSGAILSKRLIAYLIPLIAMLMLRVFEMVKKIQIKTENAIESFITNIDEMKTGMRTIKMSRQEDTEIERIESSALEIKKQTFRLQRTHALTPPVIDLSSAFVYMLVIGGGGYMALSDQFDMDGASIITFLIGLVLVFDPARHVSQFFTQLQSSLILLDSVRSMFKLKAEDLDFGQPMSVSSGSITINFKNVFTSPSN